MSANIPPSKRMLGEVLYEIAAKTGITIEPGMLPLVREAVSQPDASGELKAFELTLRFDVVDADARKSAAEELRRLADAIERSGAP